jgi:Flp pilus assembly protein TadG
MLAPQNKGDSRVRWRTLRDERGQSAVEFAVILPLLVTFLFGIVQAGFALNRYLTLTNAVQSGARAASVSTRLGYVGIQSAATQAVNSASGGLPISTPAVVDTTSTTWSSGDSVTVTATVPYTINIVGFPIFSSQFTSSYTERLE